MGRIKAPRKARPIEEVPIPRRMNLFQALSQSLIRTRVMAHVANSINPDDENWPLQMLQDTLDVTAGLGWTHVSSVRMYFASLEATVDFWVRFGFSDPAVDELLENEEKRKILHDFRNKIFHVTPVTDPAFQAMTSSFDVMVDWTEQVENAMAGYVREKIHALVARSPHKGGVVLD